MFMKTNVDSIFQEAFADQQDGKFQEAAEGYRNVLSSEPDHPSALHLLGLIEFDWKNYEAAIPLVEKSLELAPDEFQWILNYGMIMKTVGNYETSIAYYQKALSMDPGCLDAKTALTDLYSRLGEFHKALSINPECVAAKIALADRYYESGEFTEALKVYYGILCDNLDEPGICGKYVNTMKAMGKVEEGERFLRWVEEKQKELTPRRTRRDTKEGWN